MTLCFGDEGFERPSWRRGWPPDGGLIALRRGGGLFRVQRLDGGAVLVGVHHQARFVSSGDSFPEHVIIRELDEHVQPRRQRNGGHGLPDLESTHPASDVFRMVLEQTFGQTGQATRFRFDVRLRNEEELPRKAAIRLLGPWILASTPLLPSKFLPRIIPAQRAAQMTAVVEYLSSRSPVPFDENAAEEFIAVTAAIFIVSQGAPWLRAPAMWAKAVAGIEDLEGLEDRQRRLRAVLPEELFCLEPFLLAFNDGVQRAAFEEDVLRLCDLYELLERPDVAPDIIRDAAFFYPSMADWAVAHPAFPREASEEAMERARYFAWERVDMDDEERRTLIDALAVEGPLPDWKNDFLIEANLEARWRKQLLEKGGPAVAKALIRRENPPLKAHEFRLIAGRFKNDADVMSLLWARCPYLEVLEEYEEIGT